VREAARRVDLAAFVLPVVQPNADELAAHEALMRGLDKGCKGKAVWRPAETPAAVA
jgi:DNA polymerase-3 subunit epsilon